MLAQGEKETAQRIAELESENAQLRALLAERGLSPEQARQEPVLTPAEQHEAHEKAVRQKARRLRISLRRDGHGGWWLSGGLGNPLRCPTLAEVEGRLDSMAAITKTA